MGVLLAQGAGPAKLERRPVRALPGFCPGSGIIAVEPTVQQAPKPGVGGAFFQRHEGCWCLLVETKGPIRIPPGPDKRAK